MSSKRITEFLGISIIGAIVLMFFIGAFFSCAEAFAEEARKVSK